MLMSFLTGSGFYPLIWLTSDEELSFTSFINIVMESELPRYTLWDKGRPESSNNRFLQDSFGLIPVASISLWGHFWRSLHAWCQQVEGHEHTFNFKVTGAEITIKRILQCSRCLRIFPCWEVEKKIYSLLQPRETFFSPSIDNLIQLPPPISFSRAEIWTEELIMDLQTF